MTLVGKIAVALAFGALAGGSLVPAHAQNLTLRYSNWLPANDYRIEGVIKPWIADVARVTEGRVNIEIMPKVVGSVAGQYDVVTDGLADLALIVPSYQPGRFIVVEGLELPFLGDDTVKRSMATWSAYEKYLAPAGVFKEVHPLMLAASNAAHFVTRDKIIETVDEFKGMKIRTPNPAVNRTVELLGGVPVTKPLSELYELAAGGVVDSAPLALDGVESFKLDEVWKKITYVDGGFTATVIMIAMNNGKWNQISEADRKAITEISGAALTERYSSVSQDKLDQVRKVLTEKGVEIRNTSPELVENIKQVINPVFAEWIEAAKRAGLADPDAFLREVSEASGGSY